MTMKKDRIEEIFANGFAIRLIDKRTGEEASPEAFMLLVPSKKEGASYVKAQDVTGEDALAMLTLELANVAVRCGLTPFQLIELVVKAYQIRAEEDGDALQPHKAVPHSARADA